MGVPRGTLLGPRIDIAGKTYGKLRVLRYHGAGWWWCRCDPELGGCGAEKAIAGAILRGGRQGSCGAPSCHLPTSPAKHGHSPASGQSPTYDSYRNLLGRHADRLCEAWRGADGFRAFLADLGPKPARHRLQIDDDARAIGPGVCRWVPPGPVRRRGIGHPRGERSHMATLRESQVHEILKRLKAGESPVEVSADYPEVGVQTIRDIGLGKTWRDAWALYGPIALVRSRRVRQPSTRKLRRVQQPSARSIEIGHRAATGENMMVLSREYGISRQRVHQLYKKFVDRRPDHTNHVGSGVADAVKE